MMRLITASILLLIIPGLFWLLLWPFFPHWAWILPALWEIAMAYGFFFGWRHIIIKNATCISPLLPPAFEGYRVLQLSDLHIGTFYRNPGFVRQVVDKVNALNPDLIVFTGDMVNVSASEVLPFMHVLGQMKAKDGIFSVMGNHDYCEYGADKSAQNVRRNQNVLQYLEHKLGWRLLLNEHEVISSHTDSSARMAVVGVENISRPPFPDYGDLHKALEGLPDGMFKILLSHDPSHWRRGVLHQTDIALTLSGHTHAGQFSIGRLSPIRWAYHEWGGKYIEDGAMLYVSLGLGGTVPFRLGAWPEINLIELKCAKL